MVRWSSQTSQHRDCMVNLYLFLPQNFPLCHTKDRLSFFLNRTLHLMLNDYCKNYFVGPSWWLSELCLEEHLVRCLLHNWLPSVVTVEALHCYSCYFCCCLFSLQGILFSSVACVKSTQDLVNLYLHESNRVYRDKMVDNGEAIVICCPWAEFLICWFDLIFKREVLSKNSGIYNILIAK